MGFTSGEKRSRMTLVYDPHLIMGTITGRFDQNPMKTASCVEETRITVQKIIQGHNSY